MIFMCNSFYNILKGNENYLQLYIDIFDVYSYTLVQRLEFFIETVKSHLIIGGYVVWDKISSCSVAYYYHKP